MRSGRWFSLTGVTLTFLVAGAYLGQAQVSDAPVQQKTQTDHPKPNGLQSPAAAEGKQQGAAKNQERCDDPEAQNGPDICAQWVAANAARKSAELAQSSLIWNVLSFFALLLTLLATAWASRAATRAAKAAERSAKISEDTAERQLRAYVRIVPSGLDRERWLAKFEIANDGQTPARCLSCRINWHWYTPPQALPVDFQFPDKPGSSLRSVGTLGPGQSLPIYFPIGELDLTDVFHRRKSLFMYGHVEYVDIFNRANRTTFAYELQRTDRQDLNNIIMLDRHNDLS